MCNGTTKVYLLNACCTQNLNPLGAAVGIQIPDNVQPSMQSNNLHSVPASEINPSKIYSNPARVVAFQNWVPSSRNIEYLIYIFQYCELGLIQDLAY